MDSIMITKVFGYGSGLVGSPFARDLETMGS